MLKGQVACPRCGAFMWFVGQGGEGVYHYRCDNQAKGCDCSNIIIYTRDSKFSPQMKK